MVTRSRTRTRTPAVPPRPTAITSLSERQHFKNWLIYGDSGAGKTVLAGTAERNLFLTFDAEGTESAKAHGSTAQEWVMTDWKTFNEEAYEYFALGTGCEDFEWVTVDTISEGEDVCWRDYLAYMHEKKPSTRSIYKPSLDDYAPVWNRVKATVDKWNRLPINVLYTAHVLPLDQYDEEKEEDFIECMPLLGSLKNGVLSRKICGKVSLVGYLDARKKRVDEQTIEYRRLYVSKRRGMIAKNRYGWGSWVDDPTMPALVTAANSALAGATTPPPRRRRRAG